MQLKEKIYEAAYLYTICFPKNDSQQARHMKFKLYKYDINCQPFSFI